MATEASLRRQIRELESQIASLRRQEEEFRREMNRQMNRRLDAFKSEYERALQRMRDETEELYTARIQSFQEEMIRKAHEQYEALEKEAARVAALQSEKLKELSECNEELRSVLQKMKAHSEMVDQVHRSFAANAMEQMKVARESTRTEPHEFFFKGEFDIIDSHAKQVESEIRQEMYQAAASDAGSIEMEFSLLRTKVQQALHEWMLAFQDYAGIVKGISRKISLLEAHELQTAAGTFRMNEKELNYWSCGSYSPYKRKIQEAMEFIRRVEEVGVTEYLKQQEHLQRKGIFGQVSEAHKWEDELAAITTCILNERLFSDERWVSARKAIQCLQEIGYQILRVGYRSPGEELRSAEWYPKGTKYQQNPLDCFDLDVTIQGMDIVRITFLPVRTNGVAVRNECIISMEAKTLQDPVTVREIIDTNIKRITANVQTIRVFGVYAGGIGSQTVTAEENSRRKEPSSKEQIRYLERKYH